MAGKLFTKEEADKLYGPVLYSDELNIPEFQKLMDMTKENIMFRIFEEKLFILGDDRKVLYPEGAPIKKEDVFIRFSKSVAEELLKQSGESTLFVEIRETRTTVSYGNTVLEDGIDCPPFCI